MDSYSTLTVLGEEDPGLGLLTARVLALSFLCKQLAWVLHTLVAGNSLGT
jgi:hypothetical protein